MNTLTRLFLFGAAFHALSASTALAGGTQTRKISTFSEFSEGETQNAIISPEGQVIVGYADQSKAIDGTELVMSCSAQGSTVYASTGMPGSVYRVQGSKGLPKLTKLAQLPGVAVTSVVQDNQGRIFAAALPGGKIYQIKPGKEPKVFAEVLAGRIWDLKMHKGTMYAATGPEGRVFSIDRKGKAKLVLDTDAVDVMTLFSLPDALLAGTSNEAGIYQVTNKKEGQLLRSFAGKEVRTIRGDGKYLYAVVNSFESRGLSGLRKMVQKVNETSVTGSEPIREQLKTESSKASGSIYRMKLTGPAKASLMAQSAWVEIFEKDDQYFTDLATAEKGRSAMVTSSKDGKVYRVRGFDESSLIADFDQQQASAICRDGQGRLLAFSAGPAAAHRLSFAQAKTAKYTSEALDAKFPAQYGILRVRGQGKLTVLTRTGPSDTIDARWTPFVKVPLKAEGIYKAGLINAKRMRYLQFQVKLDSKDARLDAMEYFYRPYNLAPAMDAITIGPPKFEPDSDQEPDPVQEIKWSAQARDEDQLHYELSIRATAETSGWSPLNRGEPVTDDTYELSTKNLPDGTYEVSVVVSDEPSNGSALAKRDRKVSDPFMIDRTRPGFSSVKRKGQRITGQVEDRRSRIHDVSYQINNQGYRLASPSDGLFDQRKESFEIVLPNKLPASARILVRVRDEHGNRRTLSVR